MAVRMYAARVAWLDGHLRWHDGSVVWEHAGRKLAPGAEHLARAQRCLYRIARYPIAATQLFEDPRAWLDERRARLELAKRLRTLAAPDLPALAREARSSSLPATERLIALLTAEALCLNPLPILPSRVLLECAAQAEDPLQAFCDDAGAPRAARALAALLLGARRRQSGRPSHGAPVPGLSDPWLRQAYAWGQRDGLPSEPALIVVLLADENGPELARRCARALQSPSPFLPTVMLLRELLAAGESPPSVVRMTETCAAAASLAQQLLAFRDELPETRSDHRHRHARQLKAERKRVLEALIQTVTEYMRSSGLNAVGDALRFAGTMLGQVKQRTAEWHQGFLACLQGGVNLERELQRTYLEILADNLGCLCSQAFADTGRTHLDDAEWRDWFSKTASIRFLLRVARDGEVVREAVARRIDRAICPRENWCDFWQEPELYRWLVGIARDMDLQMPQAPGPIWSIQNTLEAFPTVAAARAALQPLIQGLLAAPASARGRILEDTLDSLPNTKEGKRDRLPHLVRRMPQLISFAREHEECSYLLSLAQAAVAIDRTVPEAAEPWTAALLSALQGCLPLADEAPPIEPSLKDGIPLALALADGDREPFVRIVRAVLGHISYGDGDQIRESLPVLERFPALRGPLGQLWPRQPRRCLEFLTHLGLATRLGVRALAPLVELSTPSPASERERPTGAWAELLNLAPELEPVVADYRHARRIVGGDLDPPPGVQRVLALPRRLEAELRYLEPRLVTEPASAGLETRVRNLRTRLSDTIGLHASMRVEIDERLRQATVEAQMAAAEHQLQSCYRARLETITGPLPQRFVLNNDWRNATLLSVRIARNRRLLRRLLRARLAGEERWVEEQPANLAFLTEIAARGVDTDAWLAIHPRVYPCPGASGRRVLLHLERDPLRILQMGNYFDTCLSFGGFNSFATVANACELNKRVVYATDGAGRVVGRKLIGITTEGALVGFHTYSALSDEQANTALRDVFRHYLHRFAERCRLPLADAGDVPRLFAEAWYDDGVVAWDDPEQVVPRSRPRRSRGDLDSSDGGDRRPHARGGTSPENREAIDAAAIPSSHSEA
jgi:hypothetical protein